MTFEGPFQPNHSMILRLLHQLIPATWWGSR